MKNMRDYDIAKVELDITKDGFRPIYHYTNGLKGYGERMPNLIAATTQAGMFLADTGFNARSIIKALEIGTPGELQRRLAVAKSLIASAISLEAKTEVEIHETTKISDAQTVHEVLRIMVKDGTVIKSVAEDEDGLRVDVYTLAPKA